jgi:GNAT superfamily N-acetyltransferase
MKELIRRGQPLVWRELAELSGAEVWERDGVLACIFPVSPTRSIFNSVFYEEGEALIAALEELASVYEQAGVRAWTVWTPEEDTATASALEAAGHLDDAEPMDMAMELTELIEPDGEPQFEIRRDYDLATMARINEVAYGWAEGEFKAMERARMPTLRPYFAVMDGQAVGTLAIWAHEGDAAVEWVAVLPEARGKGVSGRLLARALRDAREDGLKTTTLQSTTLGHPVYAALGYRDFGRMHMWERRRD